MASECGHVALAVATGAMDFPPDFADAIISETTASYPACLTATGGSSPCACAAGCAI